MSVNENHTPDAAEAAEQNVTMTAPEVATPAATTAPETAAAAASTETTAAAQPATTAAAAAAPAKEPVTPAAAPTAPAAPAAPQYAAPPAGANYQQPLTTPSAPGYQQAAPQYQQPAQGYAQPGQGYAQPAPGYAQAGQNYAQTAPAASNAKSKIVAGILGILLGTFGVHNFYLGFTGKAVAQLLITVLSIGMLSFVSAIWGLIEGILILVSKPGDNWHRDAAGIELQD